jgi:hypothetical protein
MHRQRPAAQAIVGGLSIRPCMYPRRRCVAYKKISDVERYASGLDEDVTRFKVSLALCGCLDLATRRPR